MKVIQIDSRQQKDRHALKHEHFERVGYKTIRSKLYVGDYMYIGGTVSVDTKRDIAELWSNIHSKQHARFVNECRNAKEAGIQLVILVENEHGITTLDDLAKWTEPRKAWNARGTKCNQPDRINGSTLAKACHSIHGHYGTMFGFCSPDEAGQKVLDILDYYERGDS